MELNAKTMKKIMLLIVFAVVLFWGFQNYTILLNAAGNLFGIIKPFILGLCIAFILNVLLRSVENLWDHIWKKRNRGIVKKLERPVCMVLSLGLVFGAVLFLLFLVVPEISNTVSNLGKAIPGYIEQLKPKYTELAERFHLPYAALPQINIDRDKIVTAIGNYLKESGASLFSKTAGITASIFSGLFSLILGLVFSIYVLLQKEKLLGQLGRLLKAFVPQKKIDTMMHVAKLSNRTFSNFVTGQCTEACIIGVLCYIGMKILRIPDAAMISTLVGFTALVPIIGAFIGTGIGAFLILMINPVKAFWFIVFILVLQQFEDKLIYPRVVGKSVGLPGIWVIIAVTIGGSLYGILGMLVSIPLCSVLYSLLQETVRHRLKKDAATPAPQEPVKPRSRKP